MFTLIGPEIGWPGRWMSGCRSRLFALCGAVAGSVDDVTFAKPGFAPASWMRPTLSRVIVAVGQPSSGSLERSATASTRPP